MSEIATLFVAVRPQADGFQSELEGQVGDQEVVVPVSADVAEAEGEIDGLDGGEVEVPVSADISEAEGAIDSIEGEPIEVPVEVDTAAAEAQVSDLGGGFSDLGGDAGGAAGALDAFTGSALGASGALGGVAAPATAAGGALAFMANEAGEAQGVQAVLGQQLTNLGDEAAVSSEHINALATEIQGYAGFSDEAVAAGAGNLLMLRNVSNETAVQAGVFDRTVRASADLARVMGTDVTGAMGALGRAVDNPAQGVMRLRRAKIQLTEAEIENIQSLQESGDMLGAQEALLAAVEARVGGVATAYGETLPGQIDITKEKFAELAETGGNDVLPMLTDMASTAENASDGFGLLSGTIGETNIGLGDMALQATGIPQMFSLLSGDFGGEGIQMMSKHWQSFTEGADEAAASVTRVFDSMDQLEQEIFGMTNANDAFTQAQFAVLDSLAQNGTAITGNTLQAIDNRQALQQLVTTTGQRVQALRDQGASEGMVAAAQSEAIGVINSLAARYGWTRSQVQTYTNAILDIPGTARTNIVLGGVNAALDQVGQIVRGLNALDGSRFSATVDIIANKLGFAAGTPSAPPGTFWVGEDGPELMAFSGGERVWNHAESMRMASASSDTMRSAVGPDGAPPVYAPVLLVDGSPVQVTVEEHARRDGIARWEG